MKKLLFAALALLALALPSHAGAPQFDSVGRTVVAGDASAVPIPVSGTVTATAGGTQDANIIQVGGVTLSRGAGAVGTGTVRVAVGQDTTTIAGAAPGTAGTASANVLTVQGIASGTALPTSPSAYPTGATPITASATGTTGATTATLAAAASKTTYLCGLSIRASATAAVTGNATVTGTVTGTLNFTQFTAPAATDLGVTEPNIGPYCIPGSAVNTAIAVVSAAPGTGGVVSVTAWGYQL